MIDKAREHASLWIDGRSFEVVTLTGREAISALFTYEITCSGGVLGASPDELVGALATVELYDGFGASRRVHGLVTAAEHRAFDDGNAIYSVTVRPAAYPLTLGRNCRVFQDQTVPEIVAASSDKRNATAQARSRPVAGRPAAVPGAPLRTKASTSPPMRPTLMPDTMPPPPGMATFTRTCS